jgi:hypothetical protein
MQATPVALVEYRVMVGFLEVDRHDLLIVQYPHAHAKELETVLAERGLQG